MSERIIATTRIDRSASVRSWLFPDETLTQKAYLNAISSSLDYGARLVVAFIVTPWLVSGLGDYQFGVWQILNRLVGYIAPSSGKPTQALKWTLANEQSSTDYEQKRRYVGSTVAVWALFLPVMTVAGAALSWFVPYWLKTPPPYFWQVRATTALLVANMAMTNLTALPHSVLQGENLGYKRMGLSTLLILVGGALTWLALYCQMGVAGVAASALAATVLSGLFFFLVARAYTPWFGFAWPTLAATRRFLGLSGWFMAWNLILNVVLASDVVMLGLLNSVESVTAYSLTKYAPETLITFVAIIVSGIVPGLGSIIGTGDLKKAARLRGELMAVTWLVLTVVGVGMVLWNRSFIALWVGAGQFAGSLPNLLIVAVVAQLVLIQTDATIIDVTLHLQRKVVIAGISAALTLALAWVLVGRLKLGIVGLSLGLLVGRAILSIGYPLIIGRFLGLALSSQLKSILRPAGVTLLLFLLATALSHAAVALVPQGVRGWLIFVISAALTIPVILSVAFYAGLSAGQRQTIRRRIRMLLSRRTG